MICNCLNEVKDKLAEKLTPKEKVVNFKCDWKDRVLRFDGGCGVGLYIESSYTKIKKDGSLYANKTTNSNFVAMSFCPFCGSSLKIKKDTEQAK